MASLEEYAFLSDYVYKGHRAKQIQYNQEAREARYDTDNSDQGATNEFAADVYQKGNEIVIAFPGTPVVMDKLIEIIFKSF